MSFNLTDETGAVQIMQSDNTGQLDVGNGTPASPLSVSGVALRKASSNILGDALAPPTSTLKSSGSGSLTAFNTVTISTPGITRAALVVLNDAVFIVSSGSGSFVIQNPGSITHNYYYNFI